MFRRKYEFKPDREHSGTLSKLYITRRQRLVILKWLLTGLVLVLLSLVQDVIMSRVRIFGATTALVPCGILLFCILLEPDSAAPFALLGSCFYYFSGSAPGSYAIALLTVLGVLMDIFRRSYLRKDFGSVLLCAAAAQMLYHLCVFGLEAFLGFTSVERLGVFCLGGALSAAVMPLLYPVFVSIGKIGGESWKE